MVKANANQGENSDHRSKYIPRLESCGVFHRGNGEKCGLYLHCTLFIKATGWGRRQGTWYDFPVFLLQMNSYAVNASFWANTRQSLGCNVLLCFSFHVCSSLKQVTRWSSLIPLFRISHSVQGKCCSGSGSSVPLQGTPLTLLLSPTPPARASLEGNLENPGVGSLTSS